MSESSAIQRALLTAYGRLHQCAFEHGVYPHLAADLRLLERAIVEAGGTVPRMDDDPRQARWWPSCTAEGLPA